MAQWLYTVDVSKVWQDTELPFSEKRDQVAEILRQSAWHNTYERAHMFTLPALVDALRDSVTFAEFNRIFNSIFDLADDDRAWIQTW